MRPAKMTPAHHTGLPAELVCSNSLKGEGLTNAAGLLKEEMRRAGSVIMAAAERCRLPAGAALAVDRDAFSNAVADILESTGLIEIVQDEVTDIPAEGGGPTIIATGPLTSESLARNLVAFLGEDSLAFYDAAAPIVEVSTVDPAYSFRASRYGKGGGDYINCPLTKEEYELFHRELTAAAQHPAKPFEQGLFFEGCLPVEELARRGPDTLRYGPMKPVGLTDPATGWRPYAVLQLRQDDAAGTLYNLVGFQTNLRWGEQKRVFSLVPALREATFVRYGVMHRNTYVSSPRVLQPTLATRRRPDLFLAGQLTGVEGYVESAAMGLLAGINAARMALGAAPLVAPPETMHGALVHYITAADPARFQPMNANFGLLPPVPSSVVSKLAAAKTQAAQAQVSSPLNGPTAGAAAGLAAAGAAPQPAPQRVRRNRRRSPTRRNRKPLIQEAKSLRALSTWDDFIENYELLSGRLQFNMVK